jgi:ABC-2 type transport system permease protein
MKVFLAFVRKEFRHVLRDRRSLIILLGLPIVMMLIFGFAISNEVKDAQLIVWDQANNTESRRLTDQLQQSKYFVLVEMLENEKAIEQKFKSGATQLAIIIPPKFANEKTSSGLHLIADASDPNTANIMVNYANAVVRDFQQDLTGSQALPINIQVETRMLYNPQLESSFNFVPGVMTLIMMLLGAMMTAVAIVKEKEMGTMEILLVSPMKPFMVVISKAVPYLVLCFVDVLLILVMAYTVLEMPMRGSLVLLLSTSLLFILTTLSLGLLISTAVQSQQMAMFIALVGLLMPSLVFSGFMFPIENMPMPLQIISNIVPTKWYFAILRSVMVKGLGLAYIWKPMLILTGMTLFFLGVSIRKFKVRLE